MFGILLHSFVPKTIEYGTTRSSSMIHKVFVYGTLKRNEPNHHWLTNKENGECVFEANGITVKKYPLIIATRYNIPFLLKKPGKGHYVRGEVYDMSDSMLKQLDILEDHPNYYVRETDQIAIQDDQGANIGEVSCWVYFLEKFKPELLNLPMMDSYSSAGPHGKQYLERSKRDPNIQYQYEVLKVTD